MMSSHTLALRHRSWLVLLFVGLLVALPPTAVGQSVASVVDEMKARHDQQLQTVDTYVVETNLYTAYHKKVTGDDGPTYQTQTKMKGDGASSFATTSTTSAAYGLQFE